MLSSVDLLGYVTPEAVDCNMQYIVMTVVTFAAARRDVCALHCAACHCTCPVCQPQQPVYQLPYHLLMLSIIVHF